MWFDSDIAMAVGIYAGLCSMAVHSAFEMRLAMLSKRCAGVH